MAINNLNQEELEAIRKLFEEEARNADQLDRADIQLDLFTVYYDD